MVTIAIPTYNRADLLCQTLAGVAAQAHPRDRFEVLVIDNNSCDHTGAVVRDLAGALPALRYLHEPRQGLAHARNRAIAEARGEIILFGDDDILVQPDWLTQMIAPLLADAAARRIGAVGGEVIPVFPDGLPGWMRQWHAPLALRADAGPIEARQSVMGANLAIPKWVLEQVGPFHVALDRVGERCFCGGESEMLRRVRAAGLEVWFAPAATVKHQICAGRTTFRYAARHAFDSARSRVVDRTNQPGASGYLATRLPANVVKAVAFALLALLNVLLLRPGSAKKTLVRAWRSCGYLYQVFAMSRRPGAWLSRRLAVTRRSGAGQALAFLQGFAKRKPTTSASRKSRSCAARRR